jgi:hypothetical protein
MPLLPMRATYPAHPILLDWIILITFWDSKCQKGKDILATGRGSPNVFKNMFSHFVDNQLTDGGDVVTLTHRPQITPLPGRFLILISVRG